MTLNTLADVVHAATSAQRVASRPGHPVRGGPRGDHAFRARLGPHLHGHGRNVVQGTSTPSRHS